MLEFIGIIAFHPHNNPTCRVCYFPHFEETEGRKQSDLFKLT